MPGHREVLLDTLTDMTDLGSGVMLLMCYLSGLAATKLAVDRIHHTATRGRRQRACIQQGDSFFPASVSVSNFVLSKAEWENQTKHISVHKHNHAI